MKILCQNQTTVDKVGQRVTLPGVIQGEEEEFKDLDLEDFQLEEVGANVEEDVSVNEEDLNEFKEKMEEEEKEQEEEEKEIINVVPPRNDDVEEIEDIQDGEVDTEEEEEEEDEVDFDLNDGNILGNVFKSWCLFILGVFKPFPAPNLASF